MIISYLYDGENFKYEVLKEEDFTKVDTSEVVKYVVSLFRAKAHMMIDYTVPNAQWTVKVDGHEDIESNIRPVTDVNKFVTLTVTDDKSHMYDLFLFGYQTYKCNCWAE